MTTRQGDIFIHIDEIVLEGCDLPTYQRQRFETAFRVELDRLIQVQGIPKSSNTTRPLEWSTSSEQAGHRLARVVYEQLGG